MKKLKQSKYDSIIILYNKIIIFSLFFLSFFTKQPFPYRWHRWCVNLYHLQQHKHSQEHEHESQRGECDANLDGGCVRLCWKMTLGVHIGRRRWWHSDSRFGLGVRGWQHGGTRQKHGEALWRLRSAWQFWTMMGWHER